MKPYYHDSLADVYHGHAPDVLRGLPAESMQMAATSPPYWGLRDYGLPPMVWEHPDTHAYRRDTGDRGELCVHEWGEEVGQRQSLPQATNGPETRGLESASAGRSFSASQGSFCRHCGAWRGSLGLEPTPELYIAHIVEVFREVRRVLRSDGVCWLNLGDSYGGSGGHSPDSPASQPNAVAARGGFGVFDGRLIKGSNYTGGGIKPKDLCGIPWRVALALQADGWWLRSGLPWVKRAAMPESADDRPNSALEYVFLLTKSARYFFDMEAVKQTPSGQIGGAAFGKINQDGPGSRRCTKEDRERYAANGRHWRNGDLWFESIQPPHGLVWLDDEMVGLDVVPKGYAAAHFATFPPNLVVPMIKAGTSERGCCPACGCAWVRVVEITGKVRMKNGTTGRHAAECQRGVGQDQGIRSGMVNQTTTLGWKPGCECRFFQLRADAPQSVKDELQSLGLI